MSLHYSTMEADDGWHAVYQIPGCADRFQSIGNALTRGGALLLCEEAKKKQRRDESGHAFAALDRSDRPLPRGLYTDKEAA